MRQHRNKYLASCMDVEETPKLKAQREELREHRKKQVEAMYCGWKKHADCGKLVQETTT